MAGAGALIIREIRVDHARNQQTAMVFQPSQRMETCGRCHRQESEKAGYS
jgi:hypothetical protein